MREHPLAACRYRVPAALLAGLALAGPAAGQSTSTPALPPAIDAATYQRVVEENVDLRREQARLTRDANDLRRRNASLLLQVQEFERKQEALTAALAGLQSPEELRSELERTRQARDTLSREVERIRAESRAAPLPAAATPAPAPDSDLYRKLERENADLRAQLSKAVDSSQSASQASSDAGQREAGLRARVAELTAEIADLKRQAAQVAGREQVFKAAIVKVARKAAAYEAALRDATAKTVVVGAPAVATNAAAATARRKTESSALEAVRKAMAAGRYREAERLCQAGLAREPANAQLHYNLGVLYDDYLDDPRAAAGHYRKYLELSPAAPDASIVRSWLPELDVKAR